jgi:hypothetical protein
LQDAPVPLPRLLPRQGYRHHRRTELPGRPNLRKLSLLQVQDTQFQDSYLCHLQCNLWCPIIRACECLHLLV